jgi:hypothetical protein
MTVSHSTHNRPERVSTHGSSTCYYFGLNTVAERVHDVAYFVESGYRSGFLLALASVPETHQKLSRDGESDT